MDNIVKQDLESIHESQINQNCFDVLSFFVAIIDLNGNISFLNKRARELLHAKDNELTGENFIRKLVTREDRGKIKLNFNAVINNITIDAGNIRYHVIDLKKERRIIDAKNVRIIDNNHNTKGILITGKDLTEYIFDQKNLQRDIQLYRTLFNNIPELNIYIFDKELRFLLAEGVEMKNIGLTGDSFTGKTLFEISNEEIKKIWTPLFQKAVKGGKARKEYQIGNYYYLIRVIPLLNNNNRVSSSLAITRNITYEKLVKKLLNKSRVEALKSQKVQSQFLARVSHDIRTPLNAIMGFAEQLLQTELSDMQKEYAGIIDKSSEHLLSLINDLLVYSKIEANQVSFTSNPFIIESVVSYVHKLLLPKAEEKNLKFSVKIDKRLDKILKGDPFRLQQVLMNMLNNAIKFTNSGAVMLSCFLQKETTRDIEVKFKVTDTGIGIPPRNLKKIFNQYAQVDSGNGKSYEGAGLGLTICKNLIEMQNGSLTVSSQKGIGTAFTFTIPYKKGKKTEMLPFDPNIIEPDKLKNKKILLVDDDIINLLLVKTHLEKFNCSFEMAKSGEEAISILNKKKFDLMLLDIHMPGISGIEVAKYLRNKKKDKKCKIIALTAAALKDEINKYSKAGIDDILIKPFREIYLYNKMCELLKIKSPHLNKPMTEIILKSEINPKPYNLFELRRMMNNDIEYINQAINTFIENSEDAISNFQKLVKEKKSEQIGEIAHKILPSYRHLEIDTVIPKLLEIKMKTLVEQDFNAIQKTVNDTITEIEKVIQYLKEETD